MAATLCAPLLVHAQSPAALAPVRDVSWDALAPPDWDPSEAVRLALQSQHMSIFDAQAGKTLREVWDKAPARAEMNGVRARMVGYVVPLARTEQQGLTAFLLVAYFGACIQSPCPPANQMVQVRLATPLDGVHTMDAVTVTGTLHVQQTASYKGISMYDMDGVQLEKSPSK